MGAHAQRKQERRQVSRRAQDAAPIRLGTENLNLHCREPQQGQGTGTRRDRRILGSELQHGGIVH